MPNFDYETLEQRLRHALGLVWHQFTPAQAQEVGEFLDAGEYGLALESLLYYMVEVNVTVSSPLCSLLKDAASRMNYSEVVTQSHDPELAELFARIWEACRERGSDET